MRSEFAKWQREAAAAPVTDPAQFNDPRYHHAHPGWPGWRVAVVIDATPDTPEGWPCWHVAVVYGEQLAGILQPARPVATWDRKTRRQAGRLMAMALEGVGERATERATTPQEMIAGTQERNLPPPVGLSARRMLTATEAFALVPPAHRGDLRGMAALLAAGEGPEAEADCAGGRATQAGLHLDDDSPCAGEHCEGVGHG